MLRLFFEFNDLSALVSVHDAETAGLPDGNLDNGDSSFGLLGLMLCQHLGIVHLIDMISGKNQQILRAVVVDKVDVLGNGVCGSAVDIQISVRFFTGREYKYAAVFCVQSPAPSGCNIAVQQD